MFKRKSKSGAKPLVFLEKSNRGSDITKPDNTSLMVNQSRSTDEGTNTDSDDAALFKVLSRVLSDDEEGETRPSTSVLRSMTQKMQSTPLHSSSEILRDSTNKNSSKRTPQSGSKSRRSIFLSQEKELSLFEKTLRQCGATKTPGEGFYQLAEDQTKFTIKINSTLNTPETVNAFMESLEEDMKIVDNLKKLLVYTQTGDDCEGARGPVQEPVLRLLLNADCLQSQLLNFILEKIAQLIVDSEDEVEYSQLVSCMLRQMRFLNRVEGCAVAAKLLEILEIAPVGLKREIIFCLPEIITEAENQDTANKLVEFLKFNSLLTHVIIDALTNLSLSSMQRTRVRGKILSRLDKCPAEYLPLLVQFITTRCEPEELPEVIGKLREEMPLTMTHWEQSQSDRTKKSQADEDSYLKLTFENLKFSVMASKQMCDAWLKLLCNVQTSVEWRPVDLMMVFVLYGNVQARRPQVLSLLRCKVKTGVLAETHVQQMYQVLSVVAAENLPVILEVAGLLLRSPYHQVADFATFVYETAFYHSNFFLRQDVVSEVLLHVGSGNTSTANMALSTLDRLVDKHLEKMSELSVSVMGLLGRLPDLDLVQARHLVDIIGRLLYGLGVEDPLGLQDEMQMWVQKQLASTKLDVFHKGLVSAAMLVKHMLPAPADDDSEEAALGVRLRDAQALLELAQSRGLSGCEVKRALFNDELATMLRESSLHSNLVETWRDRSYQHALDNLFVRDLDLECEHPMSLQYSMEQEEDDRLVFPALGFVLNADTSSSKSLPTIPSAMRLLWCSHYNSLQRIQPMLTASVVLPQLSVFDRFAELDSTQQRLVLDSLFLTANYLVECINALCTVRTGDKVLIRIKQLVEVRKLIMKIAHLAEDYFPPACQFYCPVERPAVKKRPNTEGKKARKGRKRKSDGASADGADGAEVADGEQASLVLNLNDTQSQLPGTSVSTTIDVVGLQAVSKDATDLLTMRGCLRELHCHVFRLFRMELKLNPAKVFKKTKVSDAMVSDVCWAYRATEKPDLGPADLVFILEDFNLKADTILKEKRWPMNPKCKPTASSVEHMPPLAFIQGSVKVLPKLCIKLQLLTDYVKDLLESCDGVWDAPGMFPHDSADIKLCVSALLKLISDVLSWQGFQSPSNKELLKEALLILSGKQVNANSNITMSNLAAAAATSLSQHAVVVPQLTGAISIVRAMQACLPLCKTTLRPTQHMLADICQQLLARPWFSLSGAAEHGAAFNHGVDGLVKAFFANVDNKLDVVHKMASQILDEVEQLVSNSDTLASFSTINKSNFALLYRGMCQALVSASTEELLVRKEDHEGLLSLWADIVQIHLLLVEIAKVHTSRLCLAALLKKSQAVIQLFLTKGMPVIETALRVKSSEVLKIMKAMQTITRFLHSVCCHSKVTSDAVLASHVPTIRSQCERITLEVKGMLILNKIPLDCITIAVLKNRDIRGNDILSQETNSGMEVEESELPPEDSEEDQIEPEQDQDAELDTDSNSNF